MLNNKIMFNFCLHCLPWCRQYVSFKNEVVTFIMSNMKSVFFLLIFTLIHGEIHSGRLFVNFNHECTIKTVHVIKGWQSCSENPY